MNLKLNIRLKIVPLMVLLLLCEHSRSMPYDICQRDCDCLKGTFCQQKLDASYCTPCRDCKQYNREPSRRCAKSRSDCGPCLLGFQEMGPHCSRMIRKILYYKATYQIPKQEPALKANDSQVSNIWLQTFLTGILPILMISIAIGILSHTLRRTPADIPSDVQVGNFRPSAPNVCKITNTAELFQGPPGAWSNPHLLIDASRIKIGRCEQLSRTHVIPKHSMLLQKADSFGYQVADENEDHQLNEDSIDLGHQTASDYPNVVINISNNIGVDFDQHIVPNATDEFSEDDNGIGMSNEFGGLYCDSSNNYPINVDCGDQVVPDSEFIRADNLGPSSFRDQEDTQTLADSI